MEKNTNYKVYINPNFKRNSVVKSWGTEYLDNIYINRHYPELQKNAILNNKKIYVNPNFVPINTTSKDTQNKDLTEPVRSENIILTNSTQKSKYSLVKNVGVNKIQSQTFDVTKSMNITEKSNTQNLNMNTKEIPLKRSRYCIVRKKKQSSSHKEDIKPNSHLGSNSCSNRQEVHTIHSHPLTYHSDEHCTPALNTIQNRLHSHSMEKVIKIKINKYKSIPLSDFTKKNVASKSSSFIQSKFVNNLTFSKFNPNQLKYSKSNITAVVNKVAVKPVLKLNILNKRKQVWNQNHGKTKAPKANFSINNIPCRLFNKYGKCLRLAYGNCKYLHDKKHVSLCRKFLKGLCHDKDCPLSHELTAKKIPTCYFYLKGMCTKENCPYMHIKLSDNTKICQEFLKGYCENGDKCAFRHIRRDQVQDSKDNREGTIKQPLTQNTLRKRIKTKKSIKNMTEEKYNCQRSVESDIDCRYYKENMVTNEVSCENIRPSRCKLGTLPSFIQL